MKNARLNVRLDPDTKELIRHAAELREQTLTEFVISTLTGQAGEIAAAAPQTILADDDRDLFLKLLDTPPKPDKALRQAAAAHAKAASRQDWAFEALTDAHQRDRFACGQPQLDAFIRKYAGRHASKNAGSTFVAVRPDDARVLGHYIFSESTVTFEHAPQALRRTLAQYPIPMAILGKFAIDTSVQGEGLGELLLLDALRRITELSGQMGSHAIGLHALDDDAKEFYERYGFHAFQHQTSHLFLPNATIKQAL